MNNKIGKNLQQLNLKILWATQTTFKSRYRKT